MASADDTVEAKANRALAERITRFREVIDEALASVAAPLNFFIPRADVEQGERIDTQAILRFLAVARAAGSQREVLSALLDVASSCCARSVLFIARSDALVAWDVRNVEVDPQEGSRRALHLTIPMRGDHLAARAVSSGGVVTAGPEGPGFLLTEALGGPVPARSAAVPLVVRGRTVALLYGDCGTGGVLGIESLFALIGSIGGLAIEALGPGRRNRAADLPRGDTHVVSVTGAPAARRATPMGAAAGLEAGGGLLESHAGGVGGLAPVTDAGISPATPQEPEEAEMQALLGELDGMRRESSDAPLGSDERRADADAHRLASLLISELLLYNEEAVILGRRNRDLSRRLSREIERSRQAYEARVPAALHGAVGYFEEELVRVLAGGDPSVLGG